MSMTPFKIKVSISHYELMNYALKTGDTVYSKNKNGGYTIYGELINFDTKLDCWLAKSTNMKSFPISKIDHYIEIVVIPFDQYMKKIRQKF